MGGLIAPYLNFKQWIYMKQDTKTKSSKVAPPKFRSDNVLSDKKGAKTPTVEDKRNTVRQEHTNHFTNRAVKKGK